MLMAVPSGLRERGVSTHMYEGSKYVYVRVRIYNRAIPQLVQSNKAHYISATMLCIVVKGIVVYISVS